MFDQTFVNANGQTRRPWTVAASLTLQTALVGVVLIVPLLRIPSLDRPAKIPMWLPLERVDLKLKAEPEVTSQQHSVTTRQIFRPSVLRAPAAVPRTIDLSPDAPEIANAGALAGPSLSGFLPGIEAAPPIPSIPTVKPRPESASAPVRVGGGVQSAKLIFAPKPVYPPLARATRTQGTVRIQALIGRDGVIRNLQVVSGPPLLIAVAIEAVRQWRYQPTLLNGEAVEVVTEIEVNFTLSQ